MEFVHHPALDKLLEEAPSRKFIYLIEDHVVYTDNGSAVSPGIPSVLDPLSGIGDKWLGVKCKKERKKSEPITLDAFTTTPNTCITTPNTCMTSSGVENPTSIHLIEETKTPTVLELLSLDTDHDCPLNESEYLLYGIMRALLPEFTSLDQSQRRCHYREVKQRLAYDLEEKGYYESFGYKRLYNKTQIQNELLDMRRPIERSWFLRYLSDYFHLNILIAVKGLCYTTREPFPAPVLLMEYDGRRLTPIRSTSGIFPASFLETILTNDILCLTRLESISNYKISILQDIAQRLSIPITQGTHNIDTSCCSSEARRSKKRRKSELYQDIKASLGWLINT